MSLAIAKGLKLPEGSRFSIGAVPAAIAGVAPTLDFRPALERREIEAVSLTDKLTFTGGNQGTFVGSDGFIQRATTNVPRFDHDPVSRRSLGMLLEEQKINLLARSEEFNNALWTKSNAGTGLAPVVTQRYGTAPDGTNTASRLQADRGAGNTAGDSSFIVQSVSGLSDPHTVTNSIWAKSNTGSAQSVYFRNATGSGGSTITVTDNWQRFAITGSRSGNTNNNMQIGSRGTVNTTNAVDIQIWGAQLEIDGLTSYIPTTTTTVTRTADSAVIDGTGVITGTYTMIEKPAGCAVISGTNINLQNGYTVERVMVFPASLTAGQITAIRAAM